MSLSVGSTGALMVMIVIALWLWRGGQRPVQSTALNVALIAMILGVCMESTYPTLAVAAVKWSGTTRDESCWMWLLTALNLAAHAIGLGAFVRFVLTTIAKKVETPNG